MELPPRHAGCFRFYSQPPDFPQALYKDPGTWHILGDCTPGTRQLKNRKYKDQCCRGFASVLDLGLKNKEGDLVGVVRVNLSPEVMYLAEQQQVSSKKKGSDKYSCIIKYEY